MRIVLSPEAEEFVAQQVRDGRFPDASSVIIEALAILQQCEQTAQEQLRQDIQVGIEQLDRGEGRTWSVEDAKRAYRKHRSRTPAA